MYRYMCMVMDMCMCMYMYVHMCMHMCMSFGMPVVPTLPPTSFQPKPLIPSSCGQAQCCQLFLQTGKCGFTRSHNFQVCRFLLERYACVQNLCAGGHVWTGVWLPFCAFWVPLGFFLLRFGLLLASCFVIRAHSVRYPLFARRGGVMARGSA